MAPQTRPLLLDANAGEALALIEVLVGRRRHHTFLPETLPRQDRPGPLEEAVARTITAACGAFLLEHGSAPRTVLRAGQRVHGRLWDAAVNLVDGVPFSLRFSPATEALWREAVTVLGDRLTRGRNEAAFTDQAARERGRKLFRGFATRPATTAGDHLFFALAQTHLPKLRLSSGSEQRAASRLRAGSALARLMSPAEEGPVFQGTLLDDPHSMRLVELALPAIGRAWKRSLALPWHAETLPEALARSRTLRGTVERWIAELDRRGRFDLLDPVVDLLTGAPELVPADLRERLLRIAGVRTLAERDELAIAVSLTVDPALLDGPRATLAACRYGDERFPEAQVALRLLEDRWFPRRDLVDATFRRLQGRIG